MISTILLSGGVGSRSGKNIPKQYCYLLEKRVITYCLDSIYDAGLKNELVIVYGEGFLDLLEEILSTYKDKFRTIKYIPGGETRQLSVFNGLNAVTGESVVLHESARPLITANDIKKVTLHPSDFVTMGVDIPYTVLKQKDGNITEILERSELFNVQLPQKFKTKDLISAHCNAISDNRSFTDDSSLLFAYNYTVAVIDGSHENIKITTSGDFPIAEDILKHRKIRQENQCH